MASLARGRYRIVMMSCGYVENNTTSWIIFTTFSHRERYETAAEAVIELAKDLYAKYEDEALLHKSTTLEKCCSDGTALGLPDRNYCHVCGRRLADETFDAEGFMEYVTGLHSTTSDSFGESEATATRDFAFWPWRAEEIVGAGKDEVVLIGENAERVILDALFEEREDLRKLSYDPDPEDDWRSSTWSEVRKRGTTL